MALQKNENVDLEIEKELDISMKEFDRWRDKWKLTVRKMQIDSWETDSLLKLLEEEAAKYNPPSASELSFFYSELKKSDQTVEEPNIKTKAHL